MAGTTKTMTASANRGAAPDGDEHLGEDPVAAFATVAAAAQAAWRSDGAVDGMVSIPAEMPAMGALSVNILDVGTHVWDLAKATGQDHGLNEAAVATIAQCNSQIVTEEVRSNAGFGTDLGVNGDDALANMLGFVGRQA